MSEWTERVRQIEAVLHKANQALEDALNAEKTIRLECTGCGKKTNVQVKDHAVAVRSSEIQYRIVADMMKHLEELRGEEPAEDDRPLRDLTNAQLLARAKRAGFKFLPDGTFVHPEAA